MEDYDGAVEQVRYHHHTSNVYIQYIYHSSFSRLNFRVKNDDDLPRQARDKRKETQLQLEGKHCRFLTGSWPRGSSAHRSERSFADTWLTTHPTGTSGLS